MAKGKYQEWLTADGLLLLEAWARDGLNDEQIAHNCGINAATLYDWKKKYPKISKALKKGKEVVDIEVENALYKRATGYTALEETKELVGDEMMTTKVVKKHIAPDVGAAAFWLKNRKPNEWRDKREVSGGTETEDDPITASLKEELKE